MNGSRWQACFVGEIDCVRMGPAAAFDGVVVEGLGEGADRFFPVFEPEAEHTGHVFAQVGARRCQEDARSGVGRFNCCRNGSDASANDGNIDFVGHRHFAGGLVDRL